MSNDFDYMVSDEFFNEACNQIGINCEYDRFANNFNSKTGLFNSASYCIGSSGLDSFNFDCKGYTNWLCPPPRLVLKALNCLKICKGAVLILSPE